MQPVVKATHLFLAQRRYPVLYQGIGHEGGAILGGKLLFGTIIFAFGIGVSTFVGELCRFGQSAEGFFRRERRICFGNGL